MYLAQITIQGRPHYFIRQSYRQEDTFLCRDLFELGTDPRKYIVYPGGNAFYIDEIVTNHLDALGVQTNDEQLEDIFWRFLKPDIQRVLEPFRRRDYRSPFTTSSASLDEASSIFGESKAALKDMNRQNLARLYRRRAQRFHPDKGGDHEKFVKLTRAYHALLKTKK